MDHEYVIGSLIEYIRDLIDADTETLAIFGQNIGEGDSPIDSIFFRYFQVGDNLLHLLAIALLQETGYDSSYYLEEMDLTDRIGDRLYDDEVRAGRVSSKALYDEFLAMAKEYDAHDSL